MKITYVSTYETRPEFFSKASPQEWNRWHWQQRHRLKTLEDLDRVLTLTGSEKTALIATRSFFRTAVTPHYLALMHHGQEDCPVRRQAIPRQEETQVQSFELEDPLAEEAHMPVPGITHRYPDRALFYVTHHCPVYCRHCTRKRKVSDPTTMASKEQLEVGLEYLRDTRTVRDVILPGGDPLSLSNERLKYLLESIRSIDHIEVLRLGTRNPVTLPQRIDQELLEILRSVAPVYLHTHFNHPNEISLESAEALRALNSAGCVLGNQMVLLRGINDDPEIVMDLNRRLLSLGCRPYYMLQCDMAEGITHFRTPIQRGIEIVDYLRGHIGGMGIPDFVIDLPGGGGKIELTPEYLVDEERAEGGHWRTFRNGQGKRFRIFDVD